MATRSLVVLPDDSAQPILDAISAAAKSIRVKMFVFSDPALTRAVIAALVRGGIDVIDSNPDFHVTHEKSMVVDRETAFVTSLNWATKNFTGTRDYAVVTSHKREVGEIVECFEADW